MGAVGFCFGGGVVNNLAVALGEDLAAGVPFYGAQPSAADTAKIISLDDDALRRARHAHRCWLARL